MGFSFPLTAPSHPPPGLGGKTRVFNTLRGRWSHFGAVVSLGVVPSGLPECDTDPDYPTPLVPSLGLCQRQIGGDPGPSGQSPGGFAPGFFGDTLW